MRLKLTHGAGLIAAALLAGVSCPALAGEVTTDRIANADSEPQNWLTTFQNYSSHRYSRLNEINRDNIGDLRVRFSLPISTALNGRATAEMQGAPLVDEGEMYFDDGAGVFYKVDVTPGDRGIVVWRADASIAKDVAARSRGIALGNNAVYHNLRDGRVVAIDRETGEFIWDVQRAKIEHPKGAGIDVSGEAFTAAPLFADGKLLVANSVGDAGTRGWLEALDPEDGEPIWRSYVIPAPGEPGSETWQDDHNAWKTGGGGLWTTGSYDVGQRVTIWGTANPVPMFDPEYRPGDNLFTNTAIGFNMDDGSFKWYFQYTPNESWDYDEQGVHLLYDVEIDGQMRQVVGHWGRNGYYYQLDRTSGAFINATQFVDKVTWTSGIDPKTGKPVEYDPGMAIQEYVPATRFARGEDRESMQPACPHIVGGVRWQPTAYNPDKALSYSAGIDGCFTILVTPGETNAEGFLDKTAPGGLYGAKFTDAQSSDFHGLLAAVDVRTGKLVATLDQPYENLSGVLATAGGLIFSATVDGYVTAHNDETLEQVWSFNTGIPIKAPPMSYAVGGKQYIAILAGSPVAAGSTTTALHPELANMQTGAMLYVFSL